MARKVVVARISDLGGVGSIVSLPVRRGIVEWSAKVTESFQLGRSSGEERRKGELLRHKEHEFVIT